MVFKPKDLKIGMLTPNVPKMQGVQSKIPKKYLKMSFLQHRYLCAHCAPPCIFRYIPNLGSFIVHKLQKSKNIQKVQDNYFSKCPNTTEILPPFGSHKIDPSQSNVQLLWYQFLMLTLYISLNFLDSKSQDQAEQTL